MNIYEKCKTVTEAKDAAKKFWKQRSVWDDRLKTEIIADGDSFDGCHLYPAGMTRYKHLARVPANIFPMPRSQHRQWDTQEIPEKIASLMSHCYWEYRLQIATQIETLNSMI